jgi:predicted 2-oxoglutarate/Fe(II)-dependent dioxygenase YbiX/peroxiredoxin
MTESAALPRRLQPGDFAPWFKAPALSGSPSYAFDTAAGRAILMLFFGSASQPASAAALDRVQARRSLFNDVEGCFYGITVDPSDVEQLRISQQLPGIRFFLDYGREVSRAFGAALAAGDDRYAPQWILLDRTLRVAGTFPLGEGDKAIDAFASLSRRLDDLDWAPVALVPGILEPTLCRKLIDLYEAHGGEESGFMRDVDGVTRVLVDPRHKVRRDQPIVDEALIDSLKARIRRRLVPMIQRVFQFEVTRIERFIVACYEAENSGHFAAHRDNTTLGTAHRRFAVTINLNAEDYEGGDLRFPEFGARTYRAPTGGAVVFSCSLLHEATPVIEGRRFAFLPFLYDDAAAALREQNAKFTEGELANYKA